MYIGKVRHTQDVAIGLCFFIVFCIHTNRCFQKLADAQTKRRKAAIKFNGNTKLADIAYRNSFHVRQGIEGSVKGT